jgi:hypothetical protein
MLAELNSQGEKFQVPSSKLWRSIKYQAPNTKAGRSGAVVRSWELEIWSFGFARAHCLASNW